MFYLSICVFGSFYVPGLERLPTYEWKPTPSTSPVLPHRTPTMTNGRKYVLNNIYLILLYVQTDLHIMDTLHDFI